MPFFMLSSKPAYLLLRYVDDMVLLASTPEVLEQWCVAIAMFLRERLRLALRPELTTPFPVGKGVEFVGWKTWWNRRLPRRRRLGNLCTRLAHFERTAVRPLWGGLARRIDLRRQAAAGSVARLQAVLASYAGHLRHGAAWRAWEALWQQYPWLSALFRRQGWTLDVCWSPRRLARVRRFQAQYWHLVHHAGDNTLVFFPCGRYIELYGPQRVVAAAALGLRTVRLPRASYALTVGFPVWLFGAYLSSALRQGLRVIEVQPRQTFLRHGCPLRLPHAVWLPAAPAGAASSAVRGGHASQG